MPADHTCMAKSIAVSAMFVVVVAGASSVPLPVTPVLLGGYLESLSICW